MSFQFSSRVLLAVFGLLAHVRLMAATEPTVAASNLQVTVSCGQFIIDWAPGNGYQRLVLVSPVPISANQLPVDGISYSANPNYGSGSTINGAYVVWANSGTSVSVTGLSNGIQYYVAVFEYNGNGSGINYLTSTYPVTSASPIGITVSLATNKSTFCAGETATLQATTSGGAIAFTWNPSTNITTFDSVAYVTPSASVSYTVTVYDNNGCTTSASVPLTVNPSPTVTLGTFSNTCTNSPPVTLSGGSPSGGTYSGQNVTGTTFYSSSSGTFNIIYTYTNSFGCTGRDTSTLRVNSAPAVTLSSISSKCLNVAPFQLSGGSPSGGTFSGPGVTSNTFYPLIAGTGSHTIVYTYTSTSTGCSNTASRTLTVLDTPAITFTLLPANQFCPDFGAFNLSGGIPTGGVYTGPGVTNGQFDPSSSGTGTYYITYRYTATNGCVSSLTQRLTVLSPPVVQFTPPPAFCDNNGNVLLSGGAPNGGVYTGNYVSANRFNTIASGAGQFPVVYNYTDGNGCDASASANIIVNPSPAVQLSSIPPVCFNSPPVTLNQGSPVNGYYYGESVNGVLFYPDIADTGFARIFYSYTDQNGCTSLDSTDILVRSLPEVSLPLFPSRCVNIGPYPLAGGIPAGGTYFGRGVANSTFYAAVAGVGIDSVLYTYTDSVGCADTAISTITVFPRPDINLGSDTTICNDGSIELDAGNAGSTFNWSNGASTQTIMVDTAGRGFGTFPFGVRVTNPYGCFNRDTVVVTFTYCVGIESPGQDPVVYSFYPNPFSTQAVIQLPQATRLVVSDLSGRTVVQQELSPGEHTFGSELERGLYVVRLFTGTRSTGFRMIKQ